MALPPEAAEALDDSTSPERLIDIAETFPELQALVAVNPSCPEETRAWVLEANRSAAELYRSTRREAEREERAAADGDEGTSPAAEEPTDAWGDTDAESTAVLAPVVDDERGGHADRSAHDDGGTGHRDQPPELPRVTGYLDALGDDPMDAPPGSAAHTAAQGSPVPAGGRAAAHGSPASAEHTAVPAGSAQAAEPPRRRRGLVGVAVGCLVLAVLLALAIAAGTTLLRPGDDSSSSLAASPSAASSPAAETTSPAADPSDSASSSPPPASPSSAPAVRPAPDGAADLTSIQAPSGNISCRLGEDSVSCTVTERSYPVETDCPADGPFTITVAAEVPTLDCGAPVSGGSTLEYGSSAQHGEVACTSASDGMTCWNQRTGRGFIVSRSQVAPL